MFWIGLLAGLFIGTNLGVALMCLLQINRDRWSGEEQPRKMGNLAYPPIHVPRPGRYPFSLYRGDLAGGGRN